MNSVLSRLRPVASTALRHQRLLSQSYRLTTQKRFYSEQKTLPEAQMTESQKKIKLLEEQNSHLKKIQETSKADYKNRKITSDIIFSGLNVICIFSIVSLISCIFFSSEV